MVILGMPMLELQLRVIDMLTLMFYLRWNIFGCIQYTHVML